MMTGWRGDYLAKGNARMQQRLRIRAVSIRSGSGAVDAVVADRFDGH